MNSNKLKVRLRMRIYRDQTIAIGPGKIALLRAIEHTGSITAAAKFLGMSYRRAWLLVEEINKSLVLPATEAEGGGFRGGGTRLTDVGREIIRRYQAAEDAAMQAAGEHIHAMMAMLKNGR